MPIYEYSCNCGYKLEVYRKISDYNKLMHCLLCSGIMEKEWSLTTPVGTSQTHNTDVKPYVYYQATDGSGRVRFTPMSNLPTPVGYDRIELKDHYARQKFEKRVNEQNSARAEVFREERKELVSREVKARHDGINSRMSEITSKTDNPTGARILMKKAMERNVRKIDEKAKKGVVGGEFKLAVNHQSMSDIKNGE